MTPNGKRAFKKAFRLMQANPAGARAMLEWANTVLDEKTFDSWAATPNGSARLIAFHDAVSDADDTLEAVERAIADDDLADACRLTHLGRASLKDRIAELKELL